MAPLPRALATAAQRSTMDERALAALEKKKRDELRRMENMTKFIREVAAGGTHRLSQKK